MSGLKQTRLRSVKVCAQVLAGTDCMSRVLLRCLTRPRAARASVSGKDSHVQEAQALRRTVMTKDKEAAERATLVKQEKLQRFTNRQPQRLNDLWVVPSISTRRKISGTLEAHYNGFRHVHCSKNATYHSGANY
jgi:nucleosome binding factor SPN SPT16 subunit